MVSQRAIEEMREVQGIGLRVDKPVNQHKVAKQKQALERIGQVVL